MSLKSSLQAHPLWVSQYEPIKIVKRRHLVSAFLFQDFLIVSVPVTYYTPTVIGD